MASAAANWAAAGAAMTPLPPCPASQMKLGLSLSGPITGCSSRAKVRKPAQLLWIRATDIVVARSIRSAATAMSYSSGAASLGGVGVLSTGETITRPDSGLKYHVSDWSNVIGHRRRSADAGGLKRIAVRR